MSGRLLSLTVVLLAAISLACLAYIVRAVMLTPTAPAPPPRATAGAAPPPPRLGPISRPPSQGYSVVATRNLFSSTRTEATSAAAVVGVSAFQKPSLYGVVLRDGAPLAYLEDPVTRRVAGYRLGDSIAGGTVQTIAADRVVIVRPDGKVDVLLHDPARPRATTAPPRPPATRPPAPGAPAVQAPPPAPPQPPAAPNIIRRPPTMSPDEPRR